MDYSFLGNQLNNIIGKIGTSSVYEIRLRVGYNILINVGGEYYFLGLMGLTKASEKAIMCTQEHINEIIENLTEHSIYAFNEQIKQGFLSTKEGIRVGLCGDCVENNGNIITIKNITSLNVRIPHNVDGCSNKIIDKIVDKGGLMFNTLVISPAGFGKTTLLKDLALQLNNKMSKPILIIDERGEFGEIQGQNIDSIKYSDKLFAFTYALRSMSPQIVITDELMGKNDWICVQNAKNSGVNIIASCHGKSVDDIKQKQYYIEDVFERFILLNGKDKAGEVLGVYNKEGVKM